MDWLRSFISDFLASLGADVLWGLVGGKPGKGAQASSTTSTTKDKLGVDAGHSAGRKINQLQEDWNRLQILLVREEYAVVRRHLIRATANTKVNSARIKRRLARLDADQQRAMLVRYNGLTYREFCREAGSFDMPGPIWETVSDTLRGRVYPGARAATREATHAVVATRLAVRGRFTDTWWGRLFGGRDAGLLNPRDHHGHSTGRATVTERFERRRGNRPPPTGRVARLFRRNP